MSRLIRRRKSPKSSHPSLKKPLLKISRRLSPAIMNRIPGKRISIFQEESFTLLQDILDEAGELKERVPYEKLVTTTFAEKAAGDAQTAK